MKAWLSVFCSLWLLLTNSPVWGLEGRPGSPELDAVVLFDPQPREFRVKAVEIPRDQLMALPGATFQVTYTNFTVEQQQAFQRALDILAPLISSAVPIVIEARFEEMAPTTLGSSSVPWYVRDFTGAVPNRWYPIALANKIYGSDLKPDLPDMTLRFNTLFADTYYYGLEGDTPLNKTDFISTVMHEVIHGLGFASWIYRDNDGLGYWYDGVRPLIGDPFMYNGASQQLINTLIFPNPSLELLAQITGNNIFFTGPQATAANGGAPPKIFAPSYYLGGSSLKHWDEIYQDTGNALMTYAQGSGESLHSPGPLTLGLLADLGWTVAPLPGPSLALTPLSLANSCQVGQNAVNRTLIVWNTGGGSLNYTVASDAPWLSVTPGSGSSSGEQDYLTVNFLSSGLAAGSYAANLTVSAPGAANSPQTVPVSLEVVSGTSQGIPKWTFRALGSLRSSPALGPDGTLYVGSSDYHLYAVNPDGSQKWAFPGQSLFASSPALGPDGTIYVGCSDYHLYAVNPNGSLKWAFATPYRVRSSPALGPDGAIYVTAENGSLYALRPDGAQKWAFPLAGGRSSPTVGPDGTIYVGADDQKLYALRPDGTQKWALATSGYAAFSPALGPDGTLYLLSGDGSLWAVRPDGTQKWSLSIGGPDSSYWYSTPSLGADGTIYVGSNNGSLYAVSPGGAVLWTYPTGDRVYSSPAVGADGTVFFSSTDGNLYALNPNGSKRWSFSTGGGTSSPVIGPDGTVYVGAGDGILYALNSESPGLARSTWPMFRQNPRHTGRYGAGAGVAAFVLLLLEN